MTAPYLALFVAVPLIATGITALVRGQLFNRVMLLLIPLLSGLAGAWLLAQHLSGTQVLVAQIGGFVPGIAIPFVSDSLSAVMLTVTGLTTAIVLWFAVRTGESTL